jgi:diaminopimelate decarboxylase
MPPANLNGLFSQIWPVTAQRVGGVLTIAGVDVRDLAAEFGTPLFVCAEEDFRQRCRSFRAAFGPQTTVAYAAQAFCCRGVLRWVTEEGLGVAVCTGGELEVALQAGVPPQTITLHGSNKLPSELARAVETGVGRIVVDSDEEIARLAYLTDPPPGETPTVRPRVLVRVATGVAATGHEFVASEHDDQKFGFSLASGAAAEAVRRVVASPGLDLAGLHTHIGSQIFGTDGFEMAARRMAGLAAQIRDEHGPRISELSLGGGFGISYTPDDDPADVKVIAQQLHEIVPAQWAAHRRAGHHYAVRGRDGQGRGRAAQLRERGRRNERQHPHRAVRRGVHLRARLPRVGGAAHAVPGGRPARRARGHRGEGLLPAVRPGPRGSGRGGRHRGLLPVDGQQLQPRDPARRGGRGGRLSPAAATPGDHR